MTKARPIWAIATIAGVSFATQAMAEALDRSALEELAGEPITLSATGAPQRATETPVNMVILTQADIRSSGAIDLPGVLERLAQVDVMRSSRGQADVSIRGYNTTMSPRLLVLLNGRQVYLDHYGMVAWDTIPVQLAEIRQIEVVSGPNTALFGFNAVAGVVNIVTFDALLDDVDAVSAGVGSPAYAGASGVWSTRPTERLGVRLAVGGFDADSNAGDDAASQALLGRGARDPAGRTAALNAAYDFSDRVRGDLEATWSRKDRAGRFFLSHFPEILETSSIKFGVSTDTDFGILAANVYANTLDFSSLTVAGAQSIETRTMVAQASLVAKPAPAHTLRVGAEYRRNELTQNFGDEIGYDVYALSGMWNWQASDALALTSAVRIDSLSLQRTGPQIAPGFPLTNADYDQDLIEGSVNLGAVYRMTPADSLRFAVARGVGSPSLLEYGLQNYLVTGPLDVYYAGDPSISPTIVYNAEIGWDHDLPALNGMLRASAFWQRNEDLKTIGASSSLPNPTTVLILADNIGESEMVGFELGAAGEREHLHWRAQYSWRDIDDAITLPPTVLGLDYEGSSPAHILTGGLTWVGEQWEYGADARYTSETVQYGLLPALLAEPLAVIPTDAYWQVNTHAAWLPRADTRVELSVRDLLEDETQTVGISPVERSVYLTFSRRFGAAG